MFYILYFIVDKTFFVLDTIEMIFLVMAIVAQ